jgi:hypothetical protein
LRTRGIGEYVNLIQNVGMKKMRRFITYAPCYIVRLIRTTRIKLAVHMTCMEEK